MKVLKSISLFFVYPSIMLILGFWCGVQATHFFYPGEENLQQPLPSGEETESLSDDVNAVEEVHQVSMQKETLSADTEYVLEETDLIQQTVVETTWRLPSQYIGMDREQFLAAMENYESFPPLSEMERGFASLEVLSFSRERVVVRMNYQYTQPGEGFYLAVKDNEVVVYLEDKETLYIDTGILLATLPEELQLEIIQMLYVEGESDLYDFLESYSS
jgi:hypothetical protein